MEQHLQERGFFFLLMVHRHDPKLLSTYSQLLLSRGVEGFITIDTSVTETPSIPTVAVEGHQTGPGVTNIIIDHKKAVRLALEHLKGLGHEGIEPFTRYWISYDSALRWAATYA